MTDSAYIDRKNTIITFEALHCLFITHTYVLKGRDTPALSKDAQGERGEREWSGQERHSGIMHNFLF